MLAQLPIMLGFIAALRDFDFAANAAFLWIPHLGQPDPFYVLPVLAAVGTFIQSKITTPATDASMQTMTYMFPVIILFFGLKMAAGFTLYWVASSLFAVGERYLIIRPRGDKTATQKA
jgi:YidC/Oxa1 family membrane protein insertase